MSLPQRSFTSGQSSITREGDYVVKSFFERTDYEQEKYFLSLLARHHMDFVPRIVEADDSRCTIATPFSGDRLDDLEWEGERQKWFCRVCNLMDRVWALNVEIDERYMRVGGEGFRYVRDFLESGYEREMSALGIGRDIIAGAIRWKNSVFDRLEKEPSFSALIHFDLSPRNVLVDGNVIYIIDWSRAMYSELVIEIAIAREKFMTTGEPLGCLPNRVGKMLDESLADSLAKCFSTYRRAKHVRNKKQERDYLDMVHSILSQR